MIWGGLGWGWVGVDVAIRGGFGWPCCGVRGGVRSWFLEGVVMSLLSVHSVWCVDRS